MDALAIIGLVSTVVGVAQQAVKLGHDAKPFADILWNDIFGKPAETPEQQAAVAATVHGKIAELRARLHLPLPPAQDDDV